jgi:hypothetical protein
MTRGLFFGSGMTGSILLVAFSSGVLNKPSKYLLRFDLAQIGTTM